MPTLMAKSATTKDESPPPWFLEQHTRGSGENFFAQRSFPQKTSWECAVKEIRFPGCAWRAKAPAVKPGPE